MIVKRAQPPMAFIEAARKLRIGGFVVFDLFATILAAYVLARYNETNMRVSFRTGFIAYSLILLSLGVVTHYFLGIHTRLNTVLGL